ncbi:MAG: T9SS type A sorting domain-containing protein [Calditrichaeota bacterium]|nr:T9SS type A sorting domain-containing protein [Calditrichota bacterium]
MKAKKRILFWTILMFLPAVLFAQDKKPDVIKICALRVEFKEDNNPLTTGNGKFMIDSVTTDSFAIDPAPHNRQYFQDQIAAASNYFRAVSKGRLIVEGDVYPLEDNAAFQLNKTMGEYNPNTTDEEINRGISRLFADAVKAADAGSDSIDFSAYDLVVVFHAGVGRDIDLGYDATPQDIPSLFLSESFFKKTLGDTFDGIAVNGGKQKISSGILLPETQNQDGYAIALTGFLVSNIGSYLGLYDLFSPSKQKSGVGRFGLMDAGLLNMNGLVPAPPGAFSRYLLGWDDPVEINQPQKGIEIGRLFPENDSAKPTLIKIPINNDEYYLLECRGNPKVNMDSLYQELSYNRDQLPTYMELLKTYFPDKIEIGASGVLLKADNYDWGLPGSGILIWHIDERVIREKGAENKINDDPEWRAVDIEEADGSQDIGQIYTLLDPGYQKELGWFADFWFRNRPYYLKDFELYSNEFSSTSRPATLSNWNHAYSHIRLYDFSDNAGDVMRFSFEKEMTEPGFPAKVITRGKVTAQIEGKTNAGNFLFIGTDKGEVVLVKNENSMPEFFTYYSDGDSVAALTLADIDADPDFDRLIVTFKNRITVLDADNLSKSASPRLIINWNAPAEIISTPVAQDDHLYFTCANDTLYDLRLGADQIQVADKRAGFGGYKDLAFFPDAALTPGLPSVEHLGIIVAHEPEDRIVVANSESDEGSGFSVTGTEESFAFDLPVRLQGDFALADMDRNGTLDIVFNSQRKIYAFNINGTLVTNFPLAPALNKDDALLGTPLIADLDGDGSKDLIVLTDKGGVIGLNQQNQLLANFPLTTGGELHLSPVLMQWDDDEPIELAVITDNGSLYVWELDYGSKQKAFWSQSNYDGTNNAAVVQDIASEDVIQTKELLPANRAYNYPNPNEGDFTTIRYYLGEPAEVTIRIFDLAGSAVKTIKAPGEGKTDNEVVWNVKDVASGIYLCQIEAKSAHKTERRLFKIMVVH